MIQTSNLGPGSAPRRTPSRPVPGGSIVIKLIERTAMAKLSSKRSEGCCLALDGQFLKPYESHSTARYGSLFRVISWKLCICVIPHFLCVSVRSESSKSSPLCLANRVFLGGYWPNVNISTGTLGSLSFVSVSHRHLTTRKHTFWKPGECSFRGIGK